MVVNERMQEKKERKNRHFSEARQVTVAESSTNTLIDDLIVK